VRRFLANFAVHPVARHRFERNEAAERAFRQWRPREDDVQDAQDPTEGPAA
jgi:hypothetical protein